MLKKSDYAVPANMIAEYAVELFQNPKLVELIIRNTETTGRSDDDIELVESELTDDARRYALALGLPWQAKYAFKGAAALVLAKLQGNDEAFTSEAAWQLLQNDGMCLPPIIKGTNK